MTLTLLAIKKKNTFIFFLFCCHLKINNILLSTTYRHKEISSLSVLTKNTALLVQNGGGGRNEIVKIRFRMF